MHANSLSAIVLRDGGKCLDCGSVNNLSRDHIWPKSQGGCNCALNMRLLCKRCNTFKADKVTGSGHLHKECPYESVRKRIAMHRSVWEGYKPPDKGALKTLRKEACTLEMPKSTLRLIDQLFRKRIENKS